MNQRLVHTLLLSSALLVTLAAAVRGGEPEKLEVRRANGRIELTDPVGDVEPIHSSGDYPGLDVVKLALASDGKQIAFAATLHDPPGIFALDVLEIFFDTDNKAATGVQMVFPRSAASSTGPSSTPASTSATRARLHRRHGRKAKPTRHYAAIDLSRYTGKGARQGGRRRRPRLPRPQGLGAEADRPDLVAPRHDRLRRPEGETRPDDPHPGPRGLRRRKPDSYFPEILLKLQ